MNATKIAREMASLPPEAQKQILELVVLLKARYRSAPTAGKAKQRRLTKQPFVGMWRNRKDMQDSTAWVRKLRQSQWEDRR